MILSPNIRNGHIKRWTDVQSHLSLQEIGGCQSITPYIITGTIFLSLVIPPSSFSTIFLSRKLYYTFRRSSLIAGVVTGAHPNYISIRFPSDCDIAREDSQVKDRNGETRSRIEKMLNQMKLFNLRPRPLTLIWFTTMASVWPRPSDSPPRLHQVTYIGFDNSIRLIECVTRVLLLW